MRGKDESLSELYAKLHRPSGDTDQPSVRPPLGERQAKDILMHDDEDSDGGMFALFDTN
jgi:hypothetical protein